MKKVITTVLFAVLTMGVFAQGGNRMQKRANLTPDQMAELKTKRMTLALDLNDSQQKKVYTLNKRNAIERKKMMEERKAMRESDKRPTKEEVFEKKSKMLDKMIAHKAEMKKILTPEQYDKWQKMAKRKGHKMKNKRGKKGRGHKRSR